MTAKKKNFTLCCAPRKNPHIPPGRLTSNYEAFPESKYSFASPPPLL